MHAASANDETRSLSIQTMSAVSRKVWNVVIGITGDLKSVKATPHEAPFMMCYYCQHLAVNMC
jgi:hypothetical protein